MTQARAAFRGAYTDVEESVQALRAALQAFALASERWKEALRDLLADTELCLRIARCWDEPL